MRTGRRNARVSTPHVGTADTKAASALAATKRFCHAHRRGFTLIELMIVVAVIAILSVLAYPSYVAYITKTNRKAAAACLSEYANYMERYYTTNLRYDQDTSSPPVANTLPSLDCASAAQTGRNYTYSFPAAPTASAFTVRAVPINLQLTRDTSCATLALDQTGKRTVSGSGTVAQCW